MNEPLSNHPVRNEELEIERDRYRVFIEDVADGFFETNLRGNFIFFNDAMCRIFGFSREEIKDRNFREFMDEKNAQVAYESFNKLYSSGKGVTDIIWEINRKNGQICILEISSNLIIDKNGEKTGFRGIARDVTEKHLAQKRAIESEQLAQKQYEASRRAENRYRAFLKFLPDPVFVFNLDSTVVYLNPAFEKVFGWNLKELKGKQIPFVPYFLKEETRQGIQNLLEEKVVNNFETKRLTKDGRLLDIIIDGAVFLDENKKPAGQVITLRDVTQEKRIALSNQTLFRIAKALHHYRGLDGLLAFITKETQNLIAVEGSSVILLDEEKKEFYFFAATYDDKVAGKKFKEIRFPVDKGVAGQVYRTGKPLIVSDTSKSRYFFHGVDEKSDYQTRNMVDVPIKIQDRMIGVLCAVNKKEGEFDQTDVDLMSTIANTAALPIENARINQELKRSYEEVKSLNRAKDRVIHHLSHELKTPISVMSASMGLLQKRLSALKDRSWENIFTRAKRNINRILDMQCVIEDILRERNYKTYHMLSTLLDACTDELEVLISEELGKEDAVKKIRRRIEELFGPRESIPQQIRLNDFISDKIEKLRPMFAHRRCQLITKVEPVQLISIPPDVLGKIVAGLIRNAVENTPDSGRIEVTVSQGNTGPEFTVKDFGVGITDENQRLIFDNYFTTYEIMNYSSRKPYDFMAGGKGFDLLRIKIFSERYNFKLEMVSTRCGFIPQQEDFCVGNVNDCEHIKSQKDCLNSGGTTMTIKFPPVEQGSLSDNSGLNNETNK
ncbi:MAG: PAS domain S-box protein [Thermodesulfobacteriota bacterium]|nr:PAS domain S-box protein [Thermodesulfobacteriota bacterium]